MIAPRLPSMWIPTERQVPPFFLLESVFESSPIVFAFRLHLDILCQCNPTLTDLVDDPGKSASSPVSSEEVKAKRKRTGLKSRATTPLLLTTSWALWPAVGSHRLSRILMKTHCCHVEAGPATFIFLILLNVTNNARSYSSLRWYPVTV